MNVDICVFVGVWFGLSLDAPHRQSFDFCKREA